MPDTRSSGQKVRKFILTERDRQDACNVRVSLAIQCLAGPVPHDNVVPRPKRIGGTNMHVSGEKWARHLSSDIRAGPTVSWRWTE